MSESEFRKLLEETVHKFTARIANEENISKALQNIPGYTIDEFSCARISALASAAYEKEVCREMMKTLANDKVEENLAKLKKIINDSEDRKGVKGWRPSGVPETDVAAHLKAPLVEYHNKLTLAKEEEIRELEKETAKLRELKERLKKAQERLGLLKGPSVDAAASPS